MIPEKRVEIVSQAVHEPCFSRTTKNVNANSSCSDCERSHILSNDKIMKVQEVLRARLLGLVGEGKLYANRKRLADAFGVDPTGLNNFLDEKKTYQGPNLDKVLTKLGARIVFPDEEGDATKDVCFVDAQIVGVNGDAPPIPAERYKAIPLAQGSVAAGPGMVPQDSVRGWVLALKDHSSIKYRTNLVAVEVGKSQESMVPTLHPLDIVLVDKDDFRPVPEGSIFLIREPGPDADVAIKRIYTQNRDGDTLLQFVSDNPDKKSYPPSVYSLERDYQGDLRRAIVGRVVWSWSDMTRK